MQNYEELVKENAELKQEISYLNNRLTLLTNHIFGKKSEKYITESPDQPGLFDDGEVKHQPVAIEEDQITIETHKRYKKGRKRIPADLPVKEIIHKLSEEEKICNCCKEDMSFIGYEESKELNIIPASIEAVIHKREKYACKSKKCDRKPGESPIKLAPPPAKIVPKSILSNNFLAHIVVSKFEDSTPFYRLEKMTGRYGYNLSRSTMCSLAIKASDNLEKFMELLRNELLKSHLIGIDETPFQVICEPDKPPGSKSYMWVFYGGTSENPLVYYHYSSSRSGKVADDFLKDYRGKIQTDGYSGYTRLAKRDDITQYGCWAHARREFADVLKISKKHEGANYVVNQIKLLYKVEKEAKKAKLNPALLSAKREAESLPVLEKLEKYLTEKKEAVLPSSDFGGAIKYTLNRWEQLIGYIKDGLVPIDNNYVENAIRPFCLGKKNWLFNYTAEGAKASANHYTLIETAKANGIDPYSYISYLFNEFPKLNEDKYSQLLPINIDRSKLKPYIKPRRKH